MSLAVTGATGHLGRAVVEHLLAAGVAPGEIVAGGRNLDTLADLAARGVDVRRMDYDDPASLSAAFAGARRVLIVSGMDFGRRVDQHLAAAKAAAHAGAELVAYTSAPHADTTSMQLAADHKATEEGIRALGVPFTFLRNDWYLELYTGQIPTYLAQGAVVGAAGDGLVSGASRIDLAEAAAVVLTGDGHAGAVYELGGDTAFTFSDVAATVARHSGRTVVYRNVPVEELAAGLRANGLPDQVAAVLADVDRAIAQGALFVDTGDLHRLLGRTPTTLDEAVAAALR